MRMTPSELSSLLARMKKSVDDGYLDGKLNIDRNSADSYEVNGGLYLEGRFINFPKVPRFAKCGHEIEFGILGCSCD